MAPCRQGLLIIAASLEEDDPRRPASGAAV